MANCVLVYKGGGMDLTAAQRNAILAAWGKWYESLGQATVDGGNPFGASALVAPDGTVSSGAALGLLEYTILKADSLDAATEMAQGCPVLADGGTVEVYEMLQVM